MLGASLEEAVRLALEAAEHSPMVVGPPFDFLATEATSAGAALLGGGREAPRLCRQEEKLTQESDSK